MSRRSLSFVLACFGVCSCWSDTLTLRNNAEINGRASYHDGTFTLSARYRGGPKSLKFDRAVVQTIEINNRDFNSGEPPSDISIFMENRTSTRDASDEEKHQQVAASSKRKQEKSGVNHPVLSDNDFNPSTDDVLWLRNKDRLTGHLLTIENAGLTFEKGKEGRHFERGEVRRIFVAPH